MDQQICFITHLADWSRIFTLFLLNMESLSHQIWDVQYWINCCCHAWPQPWLKCMQSSFFGYRKWIYLPGNVFSIGRVPWPHYLLAGGNKWSSYKFLWRLQMQLGTALKRCPCCHRQMLNSLSATNENVIQIIKNKARNEDPFIKSLA